MTNLNDDLNSTLENNLNDLEWQRKTCQHIISLIKDEQLLLNEVLHPEVVEITLEIINKLLILVKEDEGKS